jgi:hypothetical protein
LVKGNLQSREDELGGIGVGVSGDLVELTLNVQAEVVQVWRVARVRATDSRISDKIRTEIVQVVVEGVLNLLANLQETEEQEGREGSSRNSDPTHGGDNLEGQEQEVQPERHTEMGLVGEGKRGVANPLEVGEGILEDCEVALQGGSDSRLDQTAPHED